MNDLRSNHYRTIWTCYANIWLGFWLLTAHIALGYSKESLAWSDGISGALLIVLGALSLSYRRIWAPWAIAFLGVWLEFAPLAFWAQNPAAYLNDTVVGVLIIALSILIPGMPGRLPETGPSVPPGWSYNPSSWPQRLPVVILGTVGWFISRYLAARQLGFIDRAWDPFFPTETLEVITSAISRDFPVPDAGLGAMAYTLEVLLALKGGERRWRTMPWMVILFGLIVVPLGLVSITLILLQPLVVGAWCTLCLLTAFCMMIMIAYAVDEVVAVFQFLRRTRKEGKSLWIVFWKGGECRDAEIDSRTPPLDASFFSLFRSASWGVSIPWNLFLSALLGAFLMIMPWLFHLSHELANFDHTVGAFAIVISVISFSEVIRKIRFFNFLIGLALLVSLIWFREALFLHLAIAVLLIVLCFRNGPHFERCGKKV